LLDHELGVLPPLFEAVFKHSVSVELLRWKYADRRGESWLFEAVDGHPTLHCGLYFRDVLFQGGLLRAAQLVDLMALPKSNGLSRTDSPFAVLMRTILATLPRSENPSGIAFGFPSHRAMRLGECMGVYRAVDHLMELEFPPIHRRFGPRRRVLSSINAADAVILNGLWLSMARDLSAFALGVRDVKYLQQRYLLHPEKRYTMLLVESYWRKQPIGLAVIGPGDERRELLDIVCAWGNAPEVIGAAQCWLAESSGKSLLFSLTERFARQIASFATRCEPTQFRIMGNPFSPPACLASLEGHWWLTGGDTDYR
jgi:hypothetical protein